MYFYGELQQSLLPDALAFLGREEASGVLTCQNGKIYKQITFSGGCVVSVLSNQADERLGRSLIRRGILTRAEVRDALMAQSRLDRKLGEVLISLGVLDRTSLAEELLAQAAAGLSSLFTWNEGQFVFQSKRVSVPSDHLVWLEAEPAVYRDVLEYGCPLRDRIDTLGGVTLRRWQRTPSFPLGTEAQSVIQDLQQPRSVQDLEKRLGMDHARLLRVLMALDVIGLIDLPLRSDHAPALLDLVRFYRSVLRSIFVQTDAEKGGRGAEVFHQGWRAHPPGAGKNGSDGERSQALDALAARLPAVEMDPNGLLRIASEAEWGSCTDPEVLRAMATEMDSATLGVLMALKERFGQPLVESLAANLKLTGQLQLRRNPAFQQFVETNWDNLLHLPSRLKTSFEQGIDRFEAGELETAAWLLQRVSPDHSSYTQARDLLQRLTSTTGLELRPPGSEEPPDGAPTLGEGFEAPLVRPRTADELARSKEIELLLQEARSFLAAGDVPAALSRCLLVLSWEPANARAREILDSTKARAESTRAAAKTEADQLWAEASAELEAALQQAERMTGEGSDQLWAEDSGELKIDWSGEVPPPPESAEEAPTTPVPVARVPAAPPRPASPAPPALTVGQPASQPVAAQAPTTAGAHGDDALLLREAQTKMEAGHFQTALGVYRLLLAVDPNHALARQGQAAAQEGLRVQEQIQAFLEQARLAEQHGRTSEAIAHLEKVLKLDHGRSDVLRRLQALQTQLVEQVHRTHGGPTARPRLKVSIEKIRESDLEINEGFIVSQVDGRTDLKTLALISGLGTSATYRLVLSLVERGFVELPTVRTP